jgi:hypothetical protein
MTTAAQDKLLSQVNRLRRQVAEAEAVLGQARAKLAKAEAKLTGQPAPETGLDRLWKAALPISRERSSQHRCRVAWNRIPNHERPTVQVAMSALIAWNRSQSWRAEGNQFAPGLHRFIAERMWENLPESSDPMARYRQPDPKPWPAADADQLLRDAVTDPAEVARLLCVRS